MPRKQLPQWRRTAACEAWKCQMGLGNLRRCGIRRSSVPVPESGAADCAASFLRGTSEKGFRPVALPLQPERRMHRVSSLVLVRAACRRLFDHIVSDASGVGTELSGHWRPPGARDRRPGGSGDGAMIAARNFRLPTCWARHCGPCAASESKVQEARHKFRDDA